MNNCQNLTREKHLDHLVRVVPLLALAYGIQGFMMMSWSDGGPTGLLVLSLGVSLALSVIGMISYDQRHRVEFNEVGFHVQAPWLMKQNFKTWESVKEVEVIGTSEEFQTVVVKMHKGSYTFYFVDNGHEFKQLFEKATQTHMEMPKAA